MRATAGILSLVTADSLVVIDELGRGTSPIEGTAIAHAIAEELIRSKAACFFATHFSELATTLAGYESVVNLHLQVESTRRGAVRYVYHIVDGVPNESHYGLQLAEVADLPADVLAVAQGMLRELQLLTRYLSSIMSLSSCVRRVQHAHPPRARGKTGEQVDQGDSSAQGPLINPREATTRARERPRRGIAARVSCGDPG